MAVVPNLTLIWEEETSKPLISRKQVGYVGGKEQARAVLLMEQAGRTPQILRFEVLNLCFTKAGIAAPLVVHWPVVIKIKPGALTHSPGYIDGCNAHSTGGGQE
jgi:hypothetical protein